MIFSYLWVSNLTWEYKDSVDFEGIKKFHHMLRQILQRKALNILVMTGIFEGSVWVLQRMDQMHCSP